MSASGKLGPFYALAVFALRLVPFHFLLFPFPVLHILHFRSRPVPPVRVSVSVSGLQLRWAFLELLKQTACLRLPGMNQNHSECIAAARRQDSTWWREGWREQSGQGWNDERRSCFTLNGEPIATQLSLLPLNWKRSHSALNYRRCWPFIPPTALVMHFGLPWMAHHLCSFIFLGGLCRTVDDTV